MKVTWYGTASLMLASEDGTERIAFDPFLRFPEKDLSLVPAFREAGRVLVTHGHFDHIRDIPELYKDLATPIYCTLTPAKTLEKHGVQAGQLYVIDGGQTRAWGPLTVETYRSRHCKFDQPLIRETAKHQAEAREPVHLLQLAELRAAFQENGEMMFYEVREGEKRLQVMGSLGLREDTDYPAGADVLIMAFQGRSDIEAYAEPFVARLRPKAVWLYHYDDAFPPLSRNVDTAAFKALIEKKYQIPCRAMEFGAAVTI